MAKKIRKRSIFGPVALAAGITGGLIYRRYRSEISRSYQRVACGGKMIETACGPVQYTELGKGAPILLVHGAGGGYDQGEYFAKLFGGNYRWIIPSRFGYLGAPVPDGADASLQADAYACLLDALGINRVGVVALSMGGPSALLFALRYPQRTRALVTISAVSHALPPDSAIIAILSRVFLNDFASWSLVRLSPRRLLAGLGLPLEIQKQLSPGEMRRLDAFLETILPMGARRNGQLLDDALQKYDADQIHHIRAPTLVLHARDDPLIPFEHGEFIARNIPGTQFHPMEKGGHLAVLLDINAGARAELLEFLDLESMANR